MGNPSALHIRTALLFTTMALLLSMLPFGCGNSGPDAPPIEPVEWTSGLEDAETFVPEGPVLSPPPADAIVFEAEHFTEMNYGWEVHPDKNCSGGAYLHSKDTMGNKEGQRHGTGDFYAIGDVREKSYLRYHFRIVDAGDYRVYARIWSPEAQCHNSLVALLNEPELHSKAIKKSLHGETKTARKWTWIRLGKEARNLIAGDHYLNLILYECGMRIDQLMITPSKGPGDSAYSANMYPVKPIPPAERRRKPVHVSFDLKSMVISKELPPQCRVVLRRLHPSDISTKLEVWLRGPVSDGKDLRLLERKIDLSSLPAIVFIPIDFSEVEIDRLDRREYLLEAILTSDMTMLARQHTPLFHPYEWEVSPTVDSLLDMWTEGPLDGNQAGDAKTWKPFPLDNYNASGVFDFGLHTNGDTFHAPENKTIYVRTRVFSPTAHTALLKIQADDEILVWLDGKEILRNNQHQPVTRNVHRLRVKLSQGDHEIKMRVAQKIERWQAYLRVRTGNDAISHVTNSEIFAR